VIAVPDGDHWVLDKSAKTNHSHGSKPYERTIEQLLECGVVLVNKPPGPTSHQLAAWARNIMGINRIGHGGTLDPFATGLLTLLIGRATKVTGTLLTKPKRYVAVLRFRDSVQPEAISEILGMMDGEVYNVPPKESAVKVQVRSRQIHKIRLLDSDESGRLHVVSIHCDAGTYVRTMARDMGLILGTGCELLELHRESSGRFDDSMSCTMQQLTDAVFMWREHGDGKGLSRLMAPVESILDEMPRLVVKDGAVAAVSHGAPLARPGIVSAPKGLGIGSTVLICSIKGEAVAIASLTVKSDALPDMDVGQVAVASTVLMPPGEYPQTWTKEQS
jgi:H/ACA ribonucleoprotein complex subunit 4